MLYPLAMLELERLAWRDSFYIVRMLLPASLACILTLAWVAHDPTLVQMGAIFHVAAILFQLAVVLVVAPLSSAAAIAREREENSLPVLLLTTSDSYGVILGKYLPPLLLCEVLILGTIPILAISVALGGVDALPCIVDTCLNMAVAAKIVALTVLASAITNHTRTALWTGYVFAVVAIGISSGLFGAAYWPIFGIAAGDAFESAVFSHTIMHCATTVSLSVTIAAAALYIAHRFLEHAGLYDASTLRWRLPRPATPRCPRDSHHALRRLVSRSGSTPSMFTQTMRAILLLAMTTASFYLSALSWPIVVMIVAYGAAHHTRSLMRTGALESLQLVPASPERLGHAVFESNCRDSLVFLPALVVGSIQAVLLLPGLPSQSLAVAGAITLGYAAIRHASAQSSDCRAVQSPITFAVAALVWFALAMFVAGLISMIVGTSIFVLVGLFRDVDLTTFIAILAFTWWLSGFRLLMWGAKYPRTLFAPSYDSRDESAER